MVKRLYTLEALLQGLLSDLQTGARRDQPGRNKGHHTSPSTPLYNSNTQTNIGDDNNSLTSTSIYQRGSIASSVSIGMKSIHKSNNTPITINRSEKSGTQSIFSSLMTEISTLPHTIIKLTNNRKPNMLAISATLHIITNAIDAYNQQEQEAYDVIMTSLRRYTITNLDTFMYIYSTYTYIYSTYTYIYTLIYTSVRVYTFIYSIYTCICINIYIRIYIHMFKYHILLTSINIYQYIAIRSPTTPTP